MKVFSPKNFKITPTNLLVFLAIVFPLTIALNSIISGAIPFWYDPARDFLLAIENLKKPTLIGQPTGISGIFYGPYWIWLISLAQTISKDPRFVVILLQTLPYFALVPFALFKFKKIFSLSTIIIIWSFFILAFINYTTFLWNPHLAPIFFLVLVYLLTQVKKLETKHLLFSGILIGAIANFHLSFAVPVLISSLIYISYKHIFSKHPKPPLKHLAISLSILLTGLFITLTPLIVFELRHSLFQTKAAYAAFITQTNLPDRQGNSKINIVRDFAGKLPALLDTPEQPTYYLYVLLPLIFLFKIKSTKTKLKPEEKNLLAFLLIVIASTLAVYLSSSNPVWHYHFIGTEIIVILLLGLVLEKSTIIKSVAVVWLIITISLQAVSLANSFGWDYQNIDSLTAKQTIVEQVYKDSTGSTFSYFAYSPAIYTYDYDYLFEWLGNRHPSSKLTKNLSTSNHVYLIIPETSEAVLEDFINYKTPNIDYITQKRWTTQNSTTVIKRSKF